MRKALYTLIILSFISFCRIASAEEILEFNSHIEIQEENQILVTEEITYDFGELNKHGIFRYIPQDFKGNKSLVPIDVDFISVTDKKGNVYPYTESGFQNKEIKIGDPDITITGVHTYVIKYKVSEVMNFYDESDELYWNVTGNDWSVPIKKVDLRIDLPKESSQFSFYDYCGIVGQTKSCGKIASKTSNNDSVRYITNRELAAGEGVTVSFVFVKGIVQESNIFTQLSRYALYLIPIIIGIFLAFFFTRKKIHRFKKNRAYRKTNPIVVQYDPEDITPIEASYFHDGKIEYKDLSAFIVWSATQGYIKIIEKDGSYEFEKVRNWDDLPSSEQYFLDKLVESKISINLLGNSAFERKVKKEHKGILKLFKTKDVAFLKTISNLAIILLNYKIQQLEDKGYIENSSKYGDGFHGSASIDEHVIGLSNKFVTTTTKYNSNEKFRTHADRAVSFVFLFLAFNPGVFFFQLHILFGILWSTLMVSLFFINLILPSKPPYTDKGLTRSNYILGLRKYIEMAEEDRINKLNAPEKTPLLFEKLLPYAMVFGLEKKWIKEFDGVSINNDWYSSDTGHVFNTVMLSNFNTALSESLSPTSLGTRSGSGSGGGGFSGGGGGGGGGGSW